MADIKAKDISVAQSVGASDLILGSSIAGTTANVKVETVGNFILNNFPQSGLGNQSILQYTKDIHDKLKVETLFRQNVAAESPNVYSNVGQIQLTEPSFIFMKYNWGNAKPLGVALAYDQSSSGNLFTPVLLGKTPQDETGKTSATVVASGFVESGTYYIFVKSSVTTTSELIIRKIAGLYT